MNQKQKMKTYRTSFKTTRHGLDAELVPMKLWQKAKKLGVWNPADIDFTDDLDDWRRLDDRERDLLLRLTAQFQAGEESVTYDLLPLLQVMAEEGRIEEEMFLTSYLWEEAKHVEGFSRFLEEVTGTHGGLEHYFIEMKMNELIIGALQHIGQTLLPYGDEIPFGVMVDEYFDFGQAQFKKRYTHIEKARRQTLDEVLYGH